ncbi:polynucleotide kinase 3'-phosphatase-like protein, putative [Theileria annulata]|uniref:Polynucleotide kinase 3'-phosphatase-like protein, putative n=1 Tax=Theileria annulata TaxID=5874 RepID=Q4UG48_THEAN|nr:polynucleotide kinase 3'-phosphatase-like protein, putative [Theileria annulata]CAI73941.1 polynucleotide kinase 3'-phosphatase-like protein, putative [Theileria annulata]|eukprot:XP_954618.1 polynucleotide kinase 3'-phosphatase-like protein, putative [Theileria annulata]
MSESFSEPYGNSCESEEGWFKLPEGWKMYRTVLYRSYKDPKPCTNFAIYDMDNTLMITPSYFVEELKRGVQIQISKPLIPNDFVLFAPNVKEKLHNELKQGKGILIISNQRGMLENIPSAYLILGLFLSIQFSSERIELLLREPPGMLLFFEKKLNGGLPVDRDNSFFVGDAAGRRLDYKSSSLMMRNILSILKSTDYSTRRYYNIDENGTIVYINPYEIIKKLTISKMKNRFSKDFSDCDFKFAINNSLTFYTPDEYFYGVPEYNIKLDFDPLLVGSKPFFPVVPSGLILLIGNLSSGKTHFSRIFRNFTPMSQSDFGSTFHFMESLRKKLIKRENVVIDDINNTANERVQFVHLASSLGVLVTFVHLDLSQNLVNHLNKVKRLCCDEKTREFFQVPEVKGTFHSKRQLTKLIVERPSLDEGPNIIYTINDISFPMEHNELTQLHLP